MQKTLIVLRNTALYCVTGTAYLNIRIKIGVAARFSRSWFGSEEKFAVSQAKDATAAGGQSAREAAHAEHQRGVRGAAGAHTHTAVRKTPVQSGHAEAGHRLHQFPVRADQGHGTGREWRHVAERRQAHDDRRPPAQTAGPSQRAARQEVHCQR